MKRVNLLFIFFFLGVESAIARINFSAEHCSAALSKAYASTSQRYSELSEAQKLVLDTLIVPTVGRRAVLSLEGGLRSCSVRSKSCFILHVDGESLGQEDISVEFRSDVEKAFVEFDEGVRTLVFPENSENFTDKESQELLMQLLMGHEWHPHISSDSIMAERKAAGDPALIPRRVQVQAYKTAVELSERGERKFLYVAPTGTGKTLLFTEFLSQRIKKGKHSSYHIVLSDRSNLNTQHLKDLQQGVPSKTSVTMWGSRTGRDNYPELNERLELNENGVVIVTTPKSLKNFLDTLSPNERSEFRSRLDTLIIDEAHHAGAPETVKFIQEFVDHKESDAFLLGATATPFHNSEDISKLFGNRSFWAYLDTPNSVTSKSHSTRSIEDLVEQYSRAIKAGDLSPIENVTYIRQENLGSEAAMFVKSLKSENGIKQLNKGVFPQVFDKLEAKFSKHKSGFLSTASIESADELKIELQKRFPDKIFETLHTDMKVSDQIEALRKFRAGEINFLVTVGMLDEGIDIPSMSLYIDLNQSTNTRESFQRMGRVLRLNQGKLGVDIVTLFELNAATAQEQLYVAKSILEGKLSRDAPVHQAKSRSKSNESSGEDEHKKELSELITHVEGFFDRKASGVTLEMEKTAGELEAYFQQTGTLPSQSSNPALYKRVYNYKQKPEFLNVCSEPVREILLMDPKERASKEAMKKVSVELTQYFEDHADAPNLDSPLGRRMMRYFDSTGFKEQLSAELVLAMKARAAREERLYKLAKGLEDLWEKGQRLPNTEDKIYADFKLLRKNPNLLKYVDSENTEFKNALSVRNVAKGNSDYQLFLSQFVEHFHKSGTLPDTKSPLYRQYSHYREKVLASEGVPPALKQAIESQPKVKKGGFDVFVSELEEYFKEGGVIPPPAGHSLRNRFFNYRLKELDRLLKATSEGLQAAIKNVSR